MAKKVINILSTLLSSLLVILALLLAGVRLFGLSPYVVLSGSMSPVYPVGSLIYVKQISPEDVKEGDPITFFVADDSMTATHRVIQIDTQNKRFYTKGDANEAADGAPVHFDDLTGTPIFCIPVLGYISSFVFNPPGMYLAIGAVLILLILSFVPNILNKLQDRESAASSPKSGNVHEPDNHNVKSNRFYLKQYNSGGEK